MLEDIDVRCKTTILDEPLYKFTNKTIYQAIKDLNNQ